MNKKSITKEMREALRAGFPIEAYDYLKHKPEFTTLKAMYITERLNDVFGLGRWTIQFEIIDKTPENIVLQGEFISFDYDIQVPKQFGGHSLNRKGMELADAYKSAVTDCQSKITSYLEIGIDMFKGKIKTPEQKKALEEKYGYQQTKKPVQQRQQNTRKPQQKKPIVQKLQNEIDSKQKQMKVVKKPEKQVLTKDHKDFDNCIKYLAEGGTMQKLKVRFEIDSLLEKHIDKLVTDYVADMWFLEQQKQQIQGS